MMTWLCTLHEVKQARCCTTSKQRPGLTLGPNNASFAKKSLCFAAMVTIVVHFLVVGPPLADESARLFVLHALYQRILHNNYPPAYKLFCLKNNLSSSPFQLIFLRLDGF